MRGFSPIRAIYNCSQRSSDNRGKEIKGETERVVLFLDCLFEREKQKKPSRRTDCVFTGYLEVNRLLKSAMF